MRTEIVNTLGSVVLGPLAVDVTLTCQQPTALDRKLGQAQGAGRQLTAAVLQGVG